MSSIKHIQQQWAEYDPKMNTKPMALVGRLLRCNKHFTDQMETVYNKHGLNRPSFDVLATLLRVGKPHSLTPNELIEQMLVTSGTVTNRIDKLVAKGLVKRSQDKKDKRSVVVKLSKKGKCTIESILGEHFAMQEHLVSVLTKQERKTLSALLTKLY